MPNTPEYWKKYYEKNKEKILAKNRAWSSTPQGKEYQTKRRRAKLLKEKPDIFCKLCGNPIDKLTTRRDFCSTLCANRSSNRDRYYRIRSDPEKHAKRLAQLRGYRQHTT